MSWRTVIISNSAKLDFQLGYLVVRQSETKKIHIDEIEMLMIESTSVSLTVALLSELMKKKVKVIFCDEKRIPSSELLPYYGAHDTSAKIRNQITWSEDIKKRIWTEIVSDKIRKQANHLFMCGLSEGERLQQYLEEIEFGDSTNREGHAAKVYYNALFGLDFNRRVESDINIALNYGYSLILSCVNKEITAAGYLTQLGFKHNNMYNQFNLSSDLMEPFRIFVDEVVFEHKDETFNFEFKVLLLELLSKEVRIDGKKQVLTNAISLYVKSVFSAIESNDIKLIKFPEYE